ncbi:hypothetical protein BRPE64_CCDS00580 [Caballeronia insecticola]|uniref:Uncharacterized protein n=1 Tax=Caballeronia insecticola TaxID=758793 RepID=R4X1H5_9BURK|nr:hypothetical protein BRPE64_CCDS00580 [Caballeronia insecticola]
MRGGLERRNGKRERPQSDVDEKLCQPPASTHKSTKAGFID